MSSDADSREKSLGDKTRSAKVGRCDGRKQLVREGRTDQDLQGDFLVQMRNA